MIIGESIWITQRTFCLVCLKLLQIEKIVRADQVLHRDYLSESVSPLRLAYGCRALCEQMFLTPSQTGAVWVAIEASLFWQELSCAWWMAL